MPILFLNSPFDGVDCEYDEIFGKGTQHLKFLSGSTSEFFPIEAVRKYLNRE